MSSYTNPTQRIPYAQWKALHPERYGPQTGRGAYTVGRGAYTEGRGKYTVKDFGRSLKSAGKAVNKSDIGKMIKSEVKNMAKMGLMEATGGVMGRGAYTTGRSDYKTNALVNGDSYNQVAKTNGHALDEHGTIMLSKREFVTSINSTGSAKFSVQSFSINPALKSVFPWLSQTATNFDEYESVQMIFEFESVISKTSVSSVGSLGTVVLAANYNAGSDAFTSFPRTSHLLD
jgi:hypothetical protein